jgi:hypothetical protein
MILDTTVLVDLQREFRRGEPGAASRFLEAAGDESVLITFIPPRDTPMNTNRSHCSFCQAVCLPDVRI